MEEARDNFARLETERNETVAKLRVLLNETEARAAERTEWAQRLDRELAETREQLEKIYGSLAYRLGRRVGLAPLPPTPKAESDA